MKLFAAVLFVFVFSFCTFAQTELQQMIDRDKELSNSIANTGAKAAFPKFLTDDSVLFLPDAVNGKEYWKTVEETRDFTITRSLVYAETASNNSLGYTLGVWKRTRKNVDDQFGQYVTIWAKRGSEYKAVIDITTRNLEDILPERDQVLAAKRPVEMNTRGWSAADSTMNFLKLGMTRKGLGEAYDKFAAPDVRLVKEDSRSITGKKAVVKEMEQYTSVAFPKRNWLIESADMAYSWNPCEYANSDEGMEKGNCLHVWRLNKEKWYIVLGVFARVQTTKQPVLKSRSK